MLLAAVLFLFILEPVFSYSSPLEIQLNILKHQMKTSVDQSAKPCDDFYKFACGNWKNNIFFDHQLYNWSAPMLSEFLLIRLVSAGIFKDENQFFNKNSVEYKAYHFYSSCYHSQNNMNIFGDKILELMRNKISKNGNKSIDWIDANFLLDDLGVNPFLRIETLKNKKRISIEYPTQRWFNMTVEYLQYEMKENTIQGTKLFGNLTELHSLQTSIMSLSVNKDEPEIFTFDEFIARHQKPREINWTRLFELASNETIDHTWKVHYYLNNSIRYNRLLQREDEEILLAYTGLKFIFDFGKILTDYKYLYGTNNCAGITFKYFGAALMPWVIEYIRADKWRSDTTNNSELIRNAFLARIDQNTWYDESTKSAAKAKIHAMNSVIGYTDEMKNRTKYDLEFQNVRIDDDDFEGNSLRLRRKDIKRMRSNTFPKLSFTRASYFPNWNTFFIPLQYSRLPFYNENFPNLINFVGSSFVISYEMALAFKSHNFKLNYEGQEEKWWTNESLENYKKSKSCLKSQLLDFISNDGSNLNTKNFLSKVISDNIAGRVSYDAFLKRLQNDPDGYSKALPDFAYLNITNVKQFYFLQFAQTLCTGDISFELAKNDLEQYHGLGPIRVNQIVKNMPEFSEAYQCSLGSKMNPEKKCSVW